jgi:iron(III) transport system ATP-binding protein
MIRVHALAKRFHVGADQVRALDNVGFDVENHSFFTLLGPSGCGKSTILRCVAGLEMPDGGDIDLGDECVFSLSRGINVPPHRRRIGMVFQSYAIWPHMTVYQNVAFPLEVQRQANVRARTMAALETTGLAALADRYASRLSGGQQQRVAFARAIVSEPSVLLLDEPLSNLDAALREQMCAELRRLHERLRLTTLFVTHDQGEALSMSDRIAVMRDGRFVEVGTPEELWTRPRTVFTAQFLGGANVFPGDARPNGSGSVVQTAFGALHTTQPARGSVSVFVRPENIAIASDDAVPNRFDGKVVSQRFHGEVRDVELQVGPAATPMRCKARSGALPQGGTVSIAIRPEHVVVLSADDR